MPERFLGGSLRGFSDALSSHDPTPGGGSAAAYAAAMGAALAAMVVRLLLKRKNADLGELAPLVDAADRLRQRALELVDRDSEAFDRVAEAMRLPKETPLEQAQRTERLQGALVEAAQVPLELARLARELLDLAERLAERATRGSVSDAGVAAVLAEAALRGAALNVAINVASLQDRPLAERLGGELAALLEGAEAQRGRILERVWARMSG